MNIRYGNTITVADYNMLRKSAGWNEIHVGQAQAGINNSALLVAACDEDKTIGMARLVTDGGCLAYIADVVVLPEYQKKGIGNTMMNMILSFIDANLGEDESAYVILMSAKGKEEFYRKFGFNERPDERHGAGMYQWMKKKVPLEREILQ